MEADQEQDPLLKRLFETQRQQEGKEVPAFAEVYGKAQQKQQKMKNIRLTLTIAVALIILAGLAILATDRERFTEPVQIAAAGLNYYRALQEEGKFVVNDIRFAYDRADLQPESMSIIKTIAEMLEAHPEVKLSVEGHTDASGSSTYNQELSQARAAAVRQALIDTGIDGARLRSVGYGESKPVASNEDDAGRAKNRRVEFVGF